MGAFETFHKYMGTGLILIWYLAVIVYLFMKEKRRNIRILFLHLPILILLVFFNPLFYGLYDLFLGAETYFRLLWLLPVTCTLAYGIVFISRELQGKKRLLFAGLSAALIIVGGTLVYQNPLFSRAENIHHMPQEVVEICDMIRVEGREVVAAFPNEFLLYVRQYSPYICMPYGRENLQGLQDDFYEYMLRSSLEAGELAAFAKNAGCHYLIFSEQKQLNGSMEDYEYELIGRVGEYLVFRDNTMNFKNTMD